MWTDDAVRIGPVPPAEVGKQAIREGNERLTANKESKVLSYVPEYKEMIFWMVAGKSSGVCTPSRSSHRRVARRCTFVAGRLGCTRRCRTALGKASAGRGSSTERVARQVELTDTPPNKELQRTRFARR